MQTVHKFPIAFNEDVVVRMPKVAVITRVDVDDRNVPCVWALVKPDAPLNTSWRFFIGGTGGQFPDSKQFCGTFINKPFVWHVFRELVE